MPTTSDGSNHGNTSEEELDTVSRKSHLSLSLTLHRRKKKKSDALDPYRKFVGFYTRSTNPFINYYSVLDTGMAWENSQFGDLSRDDFLVANENSLNVYRRLQRGVPHFTQDFYRLLKAPEQIEALAKNLNDTVTAARGADISSLREKGIYYVELEQRDKLLVPRIDPAAPKPSVRGHNHPVLSRLLCPVKYLAEFDANATEFQMKLRQNKVRILAVDYPTLLYPDNGYDPDDPENGLFRSPILLRFFKHIFTAPSSAKQDLSATNRVKTRRPQAMLNDMKVVTPGSIAYSALMFRHCISSLDDWRTEDDLFKRDVFFESIVSLLSDLNDEWVKDTMNWWNIHIFGHLNSNSDDEQDDGPSTVDLLRRKQVARQKQQRAVRETDSIRDRSPVVLNRDCPPSHTQAPAPTFSNYHTTPRQTQPLAASTSSNYRDYATPQYDPAPTSSHYYQQYKSPVRDPRTQAHRPNDENTMPMGGNFGQEHRRHGQYHQLATTPLQPYDDNASQYRGGQRSEPWSSPPAPSRNRDRSRSPLHHTTSSAPSRRDYNIATPLSPLSRDFGLH